MFRSRPEPQTRAVCPHMKADGTPCGHAGGMTVGETYTRLVTRTSVQRVKEGDIVACSKCGKRYVVETTGTWAAPLIGEDALRHLLAKSRAEANGPEHPGQQKRTAADRTPYPGLHDDMVTKEPRV